MKRLTMLCLALIGCAGEDEVDAPTECDRDDRRGTYLVEFDERDGNCGPVPDQVSRIDGDNPAGSAECVLTEEDRWSRNNCRLERSYICALNGYTYEYIGFTDSNADGSELTGLMEVTVDDGLCTSTYDVTWTRQ